MEPTQSLGFTLASEKRLNTVPGYSSHDNNGITNADYIYEIVAGFASAIMYT